MSSLPYRPCVGVMLLNARGQVFIGRRKSEAGPEHVDDDHAWQMPQGGIDDGEDPRDAAFRELWEETNVRSAAIIAEAPEWFSYDLPDDVIKRSWKGRYRGQTQKWFAMRFEGEEGEIDIHAPAGGQHRPECVAVGRYERSAVIDHSLQASRLRESRGSLCPSCAAASALRRRSRNVKEVSRESSSNAPAGRQPMSDQIQRLYQAVLDAQGRDPNASRTAKLLTEGTAKMAKKLAEEAVEVGLDAVQGNREATIRESADLIYNLAVLWAECGITPDDVYAEMDRREQMLGIAEKLPKNQVHNLDRDLARLKKLVKG
jgi:phosphoribosyl-ATP pyrophosphohydrolase